jgi:hypothetical protein
MGSTGPAAWALVVTAMAGCYSFQPLAAPDPATGARLAFDINDAGRVALGGTMGPEISQVEGDLVEKAGSEYVVAVRTVRLLRGGEQVWAGEQVRLKPEYLGTRYTRKVSVGRSVALGVGTIGGFAAFLLTRDLLTGGTTDSRDPMDSVVTRLGRP